MLELVRTLWEGRWIVVAFVGVCLSVVAAFLLFGPRPDFVATTAIKPITSVQAERYRSSNEVGFFKVTPKMLLDLYIEQLEERSLFEKAIKQFELLSENKFVSNAAYDEAVVELAHDILILSPINVDGKHNGEIRHYWSIKM